jgi:hypothetical protein
MKDSSQPTITVLAEILRETDNLTESANRAPFRECTLHNGCLKPHLTPVRPSTKRRRLTMRTARRTPSSSPPRRCELKRGRRILPCPTPQWATCSARCGRTSQATSSSNTSSGAAAAQDQFKGANPDYTYQKAHRKLALSDLLTKSGQGFQVPGPRFPTDPSQMAFIAGTPYLMLGLYGQAGGGKLPPGMALLGPGKDRSAATALSRHVGVPGNGGPIARAARRPLRVPAEVNVNNLDRPCH